MQYLKKKKMFSGIIWGLTVFLLFSFTALTMYSWGRYVFFLICAVITILYASSNDGKIKLKLGKYQNKLLLFVVYTGMSSIWAINSRDSVTQMTTLLSILICYYPIYVYYRDLGTLDNFISAIKWGGICCSIYTIVFFGLDNLMRAGQSDSLRIGNEFANANTLGLFAGMAIVIQIWQILFKKGRKQEIIALLPAIIVLAASQSRKAILLVVIGSFALLILKNIGNVHFFDGLMRIIFGIVIICIILFFLSKLEIFAGVNERFNDMFNTLNGTGNVNASTEMREKLISLGIESWKRRPIFGIGIGNPHILATQYLSFNAYLHNNYVELLCGGGCVGFLLYYSMHVYCLINVIKLRKSNWAYFTFATTLIILIFVTDYAMVSYYSKLDNFYIMALFLTVDKMRQERT